MLRSALAAAIALGLVVAAASAQQPTPIPLNPSGTEAVVVGKLHIMNLNNQACLNVSLLLADPIPPPPDNSLWIIHTPTVHQFRFRAGGQTYFVDAIQTP